jgi:thioredoxin 1
MLDLVLLVLFLIFVFRIVASGLQKQPGAAAAAAMGDHGNVIVINSVQEWEAKLEEGRKDKKVIVVDFTATWCGPCRHMAPIFADLSKKHPDLIFVKVDVDQLQEIAAKWDVQAMPTFIFIKDKKLVHKIVGANKDELEKKSVFFSAAHHV